MTGFLIIRAKTRKASAPISHTSATHKNNVYALILHRRYFLALLCLLPYQGKNSQRAAEYNYGAEREHIKAVPAAYHGGVGEAAWLGGLRTGDNGADDSGADCACKLQQRVHGCVAVGVEPFGELAEPVGHNRTHGKALAEGEEEVKDDEEQRGQFAGIEAVADDGEQDGAVAEENRALGAEFIEQPAADGGEGCAEQTAWQKQAACGEGVGTADELRIVGNEKAQAEADEADE